jgi:glucose-1-phosphate adenylyltransferase
MRKKEVVALILAGGQGSRLGVLTKNIAKPAVLFGGKYRIIDFSLSNCINSGIDTVGILTQYQPQKLNSHIGIGKPWDMDRMRGGVTILSPYLRAEVGEWYKGTANAVFQNIDYIEKMDADNVIILSGDHVYKMDYSRMLYFHKENNSEATISVIEVPIEQASRYGIMNTYEDGRVYEFEEKPKEPKSTLASMGVYIFKWDILKSYLEKDELDASSSNDFGKNIIPTMLREGRSIWAYKFKGYWRDVGTIQAFWESNMDLVKRVPELNLFDPNWKIYTPNPVKSAHYIGYRASIKTSIIAEGCTINGTVKNSVLFPGVNIEEGAIIENSIIMSNSYVGNNSVVKDCIIDEDTLIGKNVKVGVGDILPNEFRPDIYSYGITVVGEKTTIPDGAEIGRNVMVDIGVSPEDFCSLHISSGKSIFKGGVC